MPKRALPIVAVLLLATTGCASSRPTYTEAPASMAPEVYIVIFPTCTAWHVCQPTEAVPCAAPCCRESKPVKQRWFE